MNEEPFINPSIAPFIAAQFPLDYQENSPLFVAFVQAYYEWANDTTRPGGAVGFTRDFLELRDVDRTTQEFLIYIKQKFINDLQLQTESDTRQLIKHAKDLYRAKGSKRALDLFFRLLYDEVISVYYPKIDILVPSSAVYTKPTYIELSLSKNNLVLESKKIVGLTSGASAFVDAIVRRVIGSRLADTAYISAVEGTFQVGEIIQPFDRSLTVGQSPTIIGSLNNLIFDVSGSGANYNVGDIVPVRSASGTDGIARITDTTEQTGIITLSLTADGYGYSSNTQLIVADTILALDQMNLSNAYARKYFQFYDPIVQPLANIIFNSANGTFAAGQTIQSYGSGAANATILSVSFTNATAGSLLVSTFSGGNVGANGTFYTSGNGITANVSVGGYTDVSATGWFVGSSNLVLSTINSVGIFQLGENITQYNVSVPGDMSIQGTGVATVTGSNVLSVGGRRGVYRPGIVFGETSNATAFVTDIGLTIGVKVTNNQFVTLPGNKIRSSSIANATLTFQGSGTTASFGVANTLLNTETISINQDSLNLIASANLAGPYGLSGNVTANSSTLFSQYLTFANVTVGSISNVYTITPGTQNDAAPIVAVIDPHIATVNRYDQTIFYINASASFVPGEIVNQAATSGRALITSVNATAMSVTNLRLYVNNSIIPTMNSTTLLVGTQSGARANVVSVYADHDNAPAGRNATITANTITSNGAVVGAAIVDAGFGFQDGDEIWLGDGSNPTPNAAYGIVRLGPIGTSKGFFSQTGGFMSSDKRFFDGYYYQNFSYEITSNHQLSEYVQALKKVVHVAGMIVFGRHLHSRLLPKQDLVRGANFRQSST